MREDETPAGTDAAAQDAAKRALHEVRRYLADEIAPMMAADSVGMLLRLPPEHGAAIVREWLEAQLSSPNRAATVSSYLYHSVKKLHHLAELGLVERKGMDRYVAGLSRFLVRLCPEGEQTDLRLKLSRISEAETTLSAPVRLLNRERGSAASEQKIRQALEHQKQEEERRQERRPPASPRLVLLQGRLAALHPAGAEASQNEETRELVARLVTKAAAEARAPGDLENALGKLRDMGVDPTLDRRMFRLLGGRIPEWEVDIEKASPGARPAMGRLLQAMHRMVETAGTREEGIQRFSEMVYAAIEQFNEGHLSQAVSMLDLAQRLVEEKKVDGEMARIVRARAQSSVSLGPLRQFASTATKHGLLRRVLSFFPVFTPESLLERLDGEPKRETRKLMLSLVEVHGTPCRPTVLERLAGYLSGTIPDPDGYFSRNVVFLLRRIPRGAQDDPMRELQLLAEFSRAERPFMVTKEAVGALANLSLPQVDRVLAQRLADFELYAVQGGSDYTGEEMLEILDRTCAALARRGTRDAVCALVAHARRQEPQLGDTVGRLRHLSACDLTGSDQLQALLDRLAKSLPARLLGVVLGRRDPESTALVQALSGTPEPGVRRLFEEIVERYPGREFANAAREALAKFRSGPQPEAQAAEGISGDLELFGLPTLLQSLADSRQTGRLVISERNGHDRAVMVFHDGKIAGCEEGQLRGMDAACQLIERPRPGNFRFEKAGPGEIAPRGDTMDVLPLLLEAIRRHDEFQEDRALAPDGASLVPTGAAPSVPEDEGDRDLVQAVWREAARGTAPESCEGLVRRDAYRVRRLYAHWLESGALKHRPAA